MRRAIVPIVEGQSEVASVPVLLRRLLGQLGAYHLEVARPFRVKRNRVVRPGELERAVEQAARSRSAPAVILVLLDADDDSPDQLESQLAERCRQTTSLPALVVLANREFESWFLGAKESLRGERGIRVDARAPDNPESIRGAKERLSRNMEGTRYIEVDDQPALAKKMDLKMAQARCPSFSRLVRGLENIVSELPPE